MAGLSPFSIKNLLSWFKFHALPARTVWRLHQECLLRMRGSALASSHSQATPWARPGLPSQQPPNTSRAEPCSLRPPRTQCSQRGLNYVSCLVRSVPAQRPCRPPCSQGCVSDPSHSSTLTLHVVPTGNHTGLTAHTFLHPEQVRIAGLCWSFLSRLCTFCSLCPTFPPHIPLTHTMSGNRTCSQKNLRGLEHPTSKLQACCTYPRAELTCPTYCLLTSCVCTPACQASPGGRGLYLQHPSPCLAHSRC